MIISACYQILRDLDITWPWLAWLSIESYGLQMVYGGQILGVWQKPTENHKLPWITMETNQDHESREPPVKNGYKLKTEKFRNFLWKDGNQPKPSKPKILLVLASTDQYPLVWLFSYIWKPPLSWTFPSHKIEIYSKQKLFAVVDIGTEKLWFKVQIFVHTYFHRPHFAGSLLW